MNTSLAYSFDNTSFLRFIPNSEEYFSICKLIDELSKQIHSFGQEIYISESTIVDLFSFFEYVRLKNETTETLAERVKNKVKRKEIIEKHTEKYKITPHEKGKKSEGKARKVEYKTKLGNHYVTASTIESLYDKIYDYYIKSQKHYLDDVFEDFRKNRVEKDNIAAGTLKILNRTYNNFWSKTNLSQIAFEDFSEDDAEDFVNQCLTIKPDMTKKYFQNQIMGPLNMLFIFLRRNKIRKDNPFRDLDIPDFYFKKTKKHVKESRVFLSEERIAVITLAHTDLIEKHDTRAGSIEVLFETLCRSGEICPLMWKDIDFAKSTLHFERELVVKCDIEGRQIGYEIVNHTKTPAGDRRIPMSNNLVSLFKRIKDINQIEGFETGLDDFVFPRIYQGEITCFSERSFFGKLVKYCKKAGMNQTKSPHDIRRTGITNLYRQGMPIERIREYAGHETIQQTLAYIINVEGFPEDIYYFNAINKNVFNQL